MSTIPRIDPLAVKRASTQVLDRAWKVDAVGALLLGALSLVGYWTGVGPYLGAKVEKVRHDLALSDAIVAREEARADNERFGTMLANLRRENQSVEITLEPFSQRHLRVGAVAQLAADSKVKLDQITPKESEAISGVSSVVRVPITLTGKGSYSQIAAFLKNMNTQFRDMSIESAQLLAQPATNGTASTFSVLLVWYARPDMPS